LQLPCYLVVAGLSVAAHQVLASATANEFVRCDQLAAASLQQCQKAQHGLQKQKASCDDVAARLRQQCQTEVKQSHNPNEPKRKARREAEIKLQQQRQLATPATPVQLPQSSGIEAGR